MGLAIRGNLVLRFRGWTAESPQHVMRPVPAHHFLIALRMKPALERPA